MPKLFCGVDFGTSNSCVAVADGNGNVRTLEVDPLNDLPTSLPSTLYICREGDMIVGRAATNAFIERNVGREVLTEQVDLGLSIENYVMSEMDKGSNYRPKEDQTHDVRETVRAHATVEVNQPGRLFQSLKSMLRVRSFQGTRVFGELYQIEALTANILKPLKEAVDMAAGRDVDTAVFGRPINFSHIRAEDAVAERRLRIAAELAGFKNVVFFYEPVAACVEYAIESDHKQRLMVVDIGGGTCDVCIMEFGSATETAKRLAESRILGVSGVSVAGDALDREIISAKMFPRFGSKSRYGHSSLPMPQFLFASITDWQNMYKLNDEETINWLLAVEACSNQPREIRALRCLIQRNYGYLVAREVEAAKKRLSFKPKTSIEIHAGDVQISDMLKRSDFAHIVENSLQKMLDCIKDAEKKAQLKPEDIDCVLTTGGTSLVPAIRSMIGDRFGHDRLQQRSTFTSVAAGLAIVAQYA